MNTSQMILVPEPRVEKSRAIVPQQMDPMQMLAFAVQNGQSAECIKQLMDLRDRFEATEARKAFDEAMAAAKAEIKPIVKKREVDFTTQKGRTHYQYEGLSDIADAIDPILARYGLSYRHRSKQDGNRLAITCVVSHRAGHFEETTLSALNDESGNKNSIQGIGSTATYLQRYTLKLALGLSAAKDDDGREADTAEHISETQAADLAALITELGGNVDKLKRYWKIETLDQILAKNYDAVIAEVRAFAEQAKEQRR